MGDETPAVGNGITVTAMGMSQEKMLARITQSSLSSFWLKVAGTQTDIRLAPILASARTNDLLWNRRQGRFGTAGQSMVPVTEETVG